MLIIEKIKTRQDKTNKETHAQNNKAFHIQKIMKVILNNIYIS